MAIGPLGNELILMIKASAIASLVTIYDLMGFFAGFQIAVFAFVGIELVGTTAAETKNPERNLPRAQ